MDALNQDSFFILKPNSVQNSTALVQKKKRHTYDVISCGLQDTEKEEEPDLTTIQEHILNKPTRYVTHHAKKQVQFIL